MTCPGEVEEGITNNNPVCKCFLRNNSWLIR